jgi:hypothetical protein
MSFTLRNMTHIGQIKAEVRTGDVAGADTNGRVYLGIGGREFRLNKPGNQFERHTIDKFIIGAGGNIDNPNNGNSLPVLGDSNAPRIEFASLNQNPEYIRFEPQGDEDKWNVEAVTVIAEEYNPGPTGNTRTFTDLPGNIWLGNKFGLVLPLH